MCISESIVCINFGTYHTGCIFGLHVCSLHVSCNMHGFGTCMLHACNIPVLKYLSESAQVSNTCTKGEVRLTMKTNAYIYVHCVARKFCIVVILLYQVFIV